MAAQEGAAGAPGAGGAEAAAVTAALGCWIAGGEGRGRLVAALCGQDRLCARCAVSLAGVRDRACYELPEPELARALRACLDGLGLPCPPAPAAAAAGAGAPACAACLGILSGATPALADRLAAQVRELGYATESIELFMVSLSVPASVMIRQHLYSAHVRSQLAASELPRGWKPLAVKEAFQLAIAGSLSRLLGGARQDQASAGDGRGRLRVEGEYRHEESNDMREVLLGSGNFRKTIRGKAQHGERRGKMQDIENINAVMAELGKVSSHALFAKFPFPPPPVSSAPELTIRIEREPVFVGGSYCKYSRQVSQSPWNSAHGDVDDSVQTLILRELAPLFKVRPRAPHPLRPLRPRQRAPCSQARVPASASEREREDGE